MFQSMGLQRVGHYLTTEQQQLKAICSFNQSLSKLVCPFCFLIEIEQKTLKFT